MEQPIIVKQTLSEQIYEHLKSGIICRQIHFGEKLVNRELQKRFGVSSTPVRDAINRLYQDGLVESITNTGARVVTFDLPLVLEVNDLVSVLSRGAAELARGAGRLEELARRLEAVQGEQEGIRTMEDYIRVDQAFHQAFFDCCGNSQLREVYSHYNVLMELLTRLASEKRDFQSERFAQHSRIVEACRRGDLAALQQALALHYSLSAEWFTANAETLGLERKRAQEE